MSSYHKILEVPVSASKAQIKNAYRKLAKEFHPDRNKSANAHEKFIQISEAYEVLYDGKLIKQAAQNTKTSKEKYWNVYSPPTNEKERAEWDKVAAERKQFYQDKARKNANKRYQKFKEENEAFKKSSFYYPLWVIYFLIQISFVFGAIAILLLPFSGHYIDPQNYDYEPISYGKVLFVIILFGPVSFFFIKGLFYFRKIIDPYFKEF